MSTRGGTLVIETFAFDGGRGVTAFVPDKPASAVIYAGDGQLIAPWGQDLAAAGQTSIMIVGVHRSDDETLRLHEYSPRFDPDRFGAHEAFLLGDVRDWVRARFGVNPPRDRTAIHGVSAGGELALALGLRHPDVFGAILCTSPGAGYRPPAPMPAALPRTYLTAGTQEPFFLENAARWATALGDAGADVVMTEHDGVHGGDFWRTELPLMTGWAFGD